MKYLENDSALKLRIFILSPVVTLHLLLSVGKVKNLKKCMKHIQKVILSNAFWRTSTVHYKLSQNLSKFIQIFCCAGLEIENLVESRVRLWKKMKTKKLLALPSYPKSLEQAILRMGNQLYYWLRFDTKEIYVTNMERFECSGERENCHTILGSKLSSFSL